LYANFAIFLKACEFEKTTTTKQRTFLYLNVANSINGAQIIFVALQQLTEQLFI
jgi:hypothetical protein